MGTPRIGELLVQHNVITPQQLNAALKIQEQKGGRIGDVLLGLGALTEVQLQHFLARQFNLSFYRSHELIQYPVNFDLLDLVPYEKALEQLMLPLNYVGDSQCEIVTLTPLSEIQEALLKDKLRCSVIVYALADRPSLVKAIRHHYGQFMLSQTENALQQTQLDEEKSKQVTSEINRMRREGLYSLPGSNDPFLREQLGNWQLVSLLGEGGMGLVYEGVHVQTQQRAAIKILRTKLSVDDVAVQRFYREVQIMRRLHHPGIIEIFEFEFREDIGFYLVMELLEGCTFAEFLMSRKADLPFASVYRVVSAVCEAMTYAHQQGIVHRDLKPDNIYLVGTQPEDDDLSSGPIKVLDFGIAKLQQEESHRLTQTGSTLGTPHYISPEQAVAGSVDHRADLYSLSVILFEVLTQKSLFEADSPFQYLMRHVYAEPPSLEQARPDRKYPKGLSQLVLKGLAKQPNDRPKDMETLRERLQRLLQPFLDGVVLETPSMPELQGAHRYHYSKNKDEVAISPSGAALPTGSPFPPKEVEFLQSDEWDVLEAPQQPAKEKTTTDLKPEAAKKKRKPEPFKPSSARGSSSMESSSTPKRSSSSSKQGGILGLGEPATEPSQHVASNSIRSSSVPSGLSALQKSRPVKPSVRSARKGADSKKKGVVIHSPRWDVSSRPRRRGGMFLWLFVVLLFGGGGGAAFVYKDKLLAKPISIHERRAAQTAWESWYRDWVKANRKAKYQRRRRSQRRRRYRRRRRRR